MSSRRSSTACPGWWASRSTPSSSTMWCGAGTPASAGKAYQHFVLATDGERRGTLLLNRDPFEAADLQALADKAVSSNLRLLFTPQPTSPSFAGDAFMDSYLRAPSSEAFLAKLPYEAGPVHDDRPFFFYTLRRAQVLPLLGNLGALDLRNLGVAILLMLRSLSAGR